MKVDELKNLKDKYIYSQVQSVNPQTFHIPY